MKNVLKALANFQQECPPVLKKTKGYGYNYADLPEVLDVINPYLKKNGLGFTQLVNDGIVKTILFHYDSGEMLESGTVIPSDVKLKGMNDFQVLGSAITYIRRYALSSILGIASDKDNDGAGQQQHPKNTLPKKPKLDVGDGAFEQAKNWIANGGDLKKVLEKYALTDNAKKELKL